MNLQIMTVVTQESREMSGYDRAKVEGRQGRRWQGPWYCDELTTEMSPGYEAVREWNKHDGRIVARMRDGDIS